MTFDHQHFSDNLSPGEILKYLKVLENLNESLIEILHNELIEGNRIVEVSTGWPEEDSIIVQTAIPFKKRHQKDGIKFKQLKDRHYWKEEYSSKNPVHLLVCPF